jgi:uncharacterized protein
MEAGAKKEPKAAEAKSGDDDLSMEEILQSIRRIIADDDSEGKKPVAAESKGNGAKSKVVEEDVPGSDVLELTEMLKDDGTVVNLKHEPPVAKVPPPPEPAVTASPDILSTIDQALAPEKPVEKAPEPVAAAPVEEKKMDVPPPPRPVEPPMAVPAMDSLLSNEAASAAADALKRLKLSEQEQAPVALTPSPVFRSGTSIEDMVAEMLRPMLKQWLDTNLPHIVERIVEREVKKLTK